MYTVTPLRKRTRAEGVSPKHPPRAFLRAMRAFGVWWAAYSLRPRDIAASQTMLPSSNINVPGSGTPLASVVP